MWNFFKSLSRQQPPPPASPPPLPENLVWLSDHQGEDYLIVLARLHQILQPQTYFEIGSRAGDSLALASCASIAIDPEFKLTPAFHNNKPESHLYSMTSDDYFAGHNPASIFGRPIDFAFLDGLHHAEFLLRDFINTEAHCGPDSVIALHDCLPLNAVMASRNAPVIGHIADPGHPYWWTGDVWLMAEALKKHRPDLLITALDAAPTGLLLVTNLNPASTTLKDNYDDITAAFDAGPDPRARFQAFAASLAVQPSADLTSRAGLFPIRLNLTQ
jgi:hypothetical protein